jgi:hypothetical protein
MPLDFTQEDMASRRLVYAAAIRRCSVLRGPATTAAVATAAAAAATAAAAVAAATKTAAITTSREPNIGEGSDEDYTVVFTSRDPASSTTPTKGRVRAVTVKPKGGKDDDDDDVARNLDYCKSFLAVYNANATSNPSPTAAASNATSNPSPTAAASNATSNPSPATAANAAFNPSSKPSEQGAPPGIMNRDINPLTNKPYKQYMCFLITLMQVAFNSNILIYFYLHLIFFGFLFLFRQFFPFLLYTPLSMVGLLSHHHLVPISIV